MQQHAAVGLDAQLLVAVRAHVGERLEAQIRRIGVRTDDVEAALGRRLRADVEGDEAAVAARDEATIARAEFPQRVLGERLVAGSAQARGGLGDRVVRRWRTIDEVDEVGDRVRHARQDSGSAVPSAAMERPPSCACW